MATLHTLQHSFDDQSWLSRAIDSLKSGDGLLLLEDAVSISCHLPTLKQLNSLEIALSFYAMDVDLQARGLTPANIPSSVKFEIINYQDFVELSLQFNKVVNWA
ncbi:MAG: sulfur relay protein TusB/DsrH [Enterobacterales bacterium]|jgi:sulfur relay protein TusB/DsrH